ncbi:hypothetical protein ID866_7120 [Astraeus odoratus]|nr:hypothetical protein ID866_7120 [Astraeus odoratus]
MSDCSAKQAPEVHVLDLRRHVGANGVDANVIRIADEIVHGLSAPRNGKTLPTLLLYDQLGLRLYDKITGDAPEYYPFAAEESIFKEHAADIVQTMHSHTCGIVPGEAVVELGAGSLHKTAYLLRALSHLVPEHTALPPVTYFALDVEESELRRSLIELTMSDLGPTLSGKIETKGLLGTYERCLQFLTGGGLPVSKTEEGLRIPVEQYEEKAFRRSPSMSSSDSVSTTTDTGVTSPSTPNQPPVHLLFLGSSIGNFAPGEDAEFLRSFPLRPGAGDTVLLGMSHDNDRNEIELAYNDLNGYTRNFIMNGLRSAGNALGKPDLFDLRNWEYFNMYNAVERVHEAYLKCVRAHTVQLPGSNQSILFWQDELVKIEISKKYSESDMFTLFVNAHLRPIQRWVDSTGRHSLFLLERPSFMFPLLRTPSVRPSTYDRFCVPTVEDWQNIWGVWDFVTLRMIPPPMLYQKPIDLRHICLFYLGHIPAFLDIHLSQVFKEPQTEPEEFKDIFERGIDPNVDDPTLCHAHSEVPENDEDWPSLNSIISFGHRVRGRLLKVYDDIAAGKVPLTRRVARVLFMTYEHEAMHLERAGTGTIPPPDFIPPPWQSLSATWKTAPKLSSSTIVVDATTVTLGIDDVESEDNDPEKDLDVDGHVFGWDNESPKRTVAVDAFRIEWRPVTNGEFFNFYNAPGQDPNGHVDSGSFKSKSKLTFPASWVRAEDGTIRVRTLYGPVSMEVAWEWPVITSYDNLSIYASVKGGRIPTEPELRVFLDKFASGYEGGANVGFRNWHPIPATMGLEKNDGKGHNGGVWEWTSTVMDNHAGFVTSSLYPGYTSDFFDGAHNVVLGGSYATIPRIYERRSFRNWYQRNYPYAWIGARVAYDVN